MKKIFVWALLPALAAGLVACGPGTPPPTQPETTVAQAEATTQIPPVILYLPNENADGFVMKAAQTDGSVEDIVALLVGEGALPAGCAPLSFSAEEAALDMNEAFGRAAGATGTTGEYLLFGSLVNTLLKYYGLESVFVTAQGQVIETGHAAYDFELRFYENQVAVTEEESPG